MTAVVQIFIMKNGALEGTEMVSGDRFVIGSDAAGAVVLDDPSVGARHVGVFVHEGKLAIQDLGAPGGTLVNGAPISGARYLNAREDVVVGAYTLKLKLMPARGASAVPSGPVPVATPSAPPQPAPVPAPAPVQARPRPGIAVGHGLDELEKTIPGPPPPTDPPSLGSDDRTIVDTAPRRPPPPPQPSLSMSSTDTTSGTSTSPSAPPAAVLALAFLDDEDGEHGEQDEPWSLVERLVRPPEQAAGKHPVVEIVHYCGERVVDHRVLKEGDRFVLGDTWTKSQRTDRGLIKPIPLVRLKKDGVAEILQAEGVTGKVLRQGIQAELPAGAAAPLVDGELCSLRIGQEKIFVRFAGVPALVWTKEQLIEARAERRLTALSAFFAVTFLAFLVGMSWLYGFRAKNEDIIELGDDGFAEVVVKDLEFEEPKKKEPPPPPVKAPDPTPQKEPESKTPPTPTPPKDSQPKAAPTEAAPPQPTEAPKTGLAAALSNIPKVNDSASSQNLNAALSNIKGVRVPGAQGGFKTSALTGKGPSSGVQIGGAAGGVATSGINSLIRKDGAAGSLGGKGDRAVAGKVTTQPRLSQMKGTGELSKDEIQRVINSHVGEIQYCYEKQLRGNSGLAGRVVLEWTVTSSGSVSVVKVSTSSLSSSDATKCMMDKVKKWKFPKPRGSGNVTIVYPFVFNTI